MMGVIGDCERLKEFKEARAGWGKWEVERDCWEAFDCWDASGSWDASVPDSSP